MLRETGHERERDSGLAQYKVVQESLGGGSDEDSFQSVSTDANATDYNLESPSRNVTVRRPASSTSPRRQSPEKSRSRSGSIRSPLRRNPQQNRSNVREQATETRDESTRSRLRNPLDSKREPAGSARRKTKTPRRRPERASDNIPQRRKERVIRDILRFQETTDLLIPKLPFARVIREILMNRTTETMRISPSALMALQESAELYMVHLFTDAYRCAFHRDRETVIAKDIEFVRLIRGRIDPGN